MTTHTPGPWAIDPCSDETIAIHSPAEDRHVCTLEARDQGEATREADAALIAASPDLLAVCEEGIRLYEKYALVAQPVEGEGLSAGGWANAARDAISKARPVK